MKIILSGDTHGNIDRFKLKKIRKSKTLTKDDLLIILGDWGVLWGPGYEDEEKRLIDWYDRFPCQVAIEDGNHDNIDKLEALPVEDWNGGKVGRISDNIVHLRRGEIYDIAGKKFFVFGGGLSIDRDQRTIGINWWPNEIASREEFDYGWENLELHAYTVDYVLTHVPPRFIIPSLGFQIYSEKMRDPVTEYLDRIENVIQFDSWYFGHMHVDAEIETEGGKFFGLYNNLRELELNLEEDEDE